MATTKKSFTADSSWHSVFNALPDDIAGKLIKRILSFVNGEESNTEDYTVNALFEQIKPTLKITSKIITSEVDITERKRLFGLALEKYLPTYGREMLVDFYDYWVEPTKSQKSFRQELEKTWDLERRLKTWHRNNQKKYNKPQTEDAQKIGRMTMETAQKNFTTFANVKIPQD